MNAENDHSDHSANPTHFVKEEIETNENLGLPKGHTENQRQS